MSTFLEHLRECDAIAAHERAVPPLGGPPPKPVAQPGSIGATQAWKRYVPTEERPRPRWAGGSPYATTKSRTRGPKVTRRFGSLDESPPH